MGTGSLSIPAEALTPKGVLGMWESILMSVYYMKYMNKSEKNLLQPNIGNPILLMYHIYR